MMRWDNQLVEVSAYFQELSNSRLKLIPHHSKIEFENSSVGPRMPKRMIGLSARGHCLDQSAQHCSTFAQVTGNDSCGRV